MWLILSKWVLHSCMNLENADFDFVAVEQNLVDLEKGPLREFIFLIDHDDLGTYAAVFF